MKVQPSESHSRSASTIEEPRRNVMLQQYWSLAMMGAWVLWRESEKVKEACRVFVDRPGLPISLNNVLNFAEWNERAAAAERGEDPAIYRAVTSPFVQRAITEICDALENGNIRGIGTVPGTQVRRQLNIVDFIKIDIGTGSAIDDKREVDGLYAAGSVDPMMLDVRVLTADVIQIWPGLTSEVSAIDRLKVTKSDFAAEARSGKDKKVEERKRLVKQIWFAMRDSDGNCDRGKLLASSNAELKKLRLKTIGRQTLVRYLTSFAAHSE